MNVSFFDYKLIIYTNKIILYNEYEEISIESKIKKLHPNEVKKLVNDYFFPLWQYNISVE